MLTERESEMDPQEMMTETSFEEAEITKTQSVSEAVSEGITESQTEEVSEESTEAETAEEVTENATEDLSEEEPDTEATQGEYKVNIVKGEELGVALDHEDRFVEIMQKLCRDAVAFPF